MKKLLFIILFVGCGLSLLAQNGAAKEKIESARIALITQRLALSPEEAEKFWPLYWQFSKEREQIKSEYIERRRLYGNEGMTEEESADLLALGLELKEKELKLERSYIQKFNQVISSQQIIELRRAEEDFRKMLIERLQERRRRGNPNNNR